jgi:ribosomal protein S18 acetylase RimI-like enzyme
MSETTIRLESMQPQQSQALIKLLIYAFRSHFKQCHNLSDTQLIHLFAKRLETSFEDASTHRMIAFDGDKMVGTLCLKWKPEFDQAKVKNSFFSKEIMALLGKWEFFKLALSLHQLKHDPALFECYIADITVHPEYQAQDIEELLVQWAYDFAKNDPRFDLLTLHVNGNNKDAARLYEKFFFKTCLQKSSFTRSILFGDSRWNYMTLPLK